MLSLVADRSTCARRKVGAIITDVRGQVLSTGYNGVPRGFPHCIDEPCAGAKDESGDNTRCLAVHAEQNALLQCREIDLAHTLYVSCSPCFICAKLILNTPIVEIFFKEKYAEDGGYQVLRRKYLKESHLLGDGAFFRITL